MYYAFMPVNKTTIMDRVRRFTGNKALGANPEIRRIQQLEMTVNERRVEALQRVKTELGSKRLTDAERLYELLMQTGLEPTEVHKLCILARVTGFFHMLNSDAAAEQTELDIFVKNAMAETGFSYGEILSLTRSVCEAFCIPNMAFPVEGVSEGYSSDSIYVIPAGYYADDLTYVKSALDRAGRTGSMLTAEETDRLMQLVRMGIPKAKYYMGIYLLRSEYDDEVCEPVLKGLYSDEVMQRYCSDNGYTKNATELAVGLIREAANAGDMEASAAMGDYFYAHDEWDKAFAYYTGYASQACTKERHGHITELLNWRSKNKKALAVDVVMFFLSLLFVVIAPGMPVFSRHLFWAYLIEAIAALVLLWSIISYHRINPFRRRPGLTVFLYFAWFLYALICVVF